MISIIGCGNSNRSDDGVGVYVAQKLMRGNVPENVRVFDAGTSGMEVMFQAQGSSALIIIDANQSDSSPGAIFEVPGEVLANIPEPAFNLHGFRWDHAIYAGKKIFKENFPEEISVYLIEVQDLSFGLELSAPVKKSADFVVSKILEKLGQRK